MVTLVKHEWHQHDRQYAYELDETTLSEIYPDLDEDEIKQKLADIESGEVDIEDVLNDADEEDVEIEWDFQYDDCWTDRKGGYDVTYKIGDEDSWVEPTKDPEPTHKCVNCKWTGQSYDAEWKFSEDEDSDDEPTKVCPMCESATELTEAGIKEDQERKEREARWAKESEDTDGETESDFDSNKALEELDEAFKDLKKEELSLEPNAPWPFDNAVEVEDSDEEEDEREHVSKLEDVYPESTYTIRMWARTTESGLIKLNKSQYDYWSENEDDLDDACNGNYDYEENDTPKRAQIDEYYNMKTVQEFYGGEFEDCNMTIEDSEGNTIFEGDPTEFLSTVHGDEDWFEFYEETEEFYAEHGQKKGYYLFYKQGGKGGYYQSTIEGTFEPKKLTFTTTDLDGTTHINGVLYNSEKMDDEGIDEQYNNWRGQWAEFTLHEVE